MQNPNPLGAALALSLGAGAATLTAWQPAVVAAVFELCLVGVMVIYELLGPAKPPSVSPVQGTSAALPAAPVGISTEKPLTSSTRPKPPPLLYKSKVGSLKAFVLDRPFPREGARTEMKALMHDYRAWRAQNDRTPLDLDGSLDGIEKICRQTGVEIEVGDDQRVYCIGVKLGDSIAVAMH